MPPAVVDEFLVDLVADDEQIVLDRQLDDPAELLPVGLFGLQRITARVRGVRACSSSAIGGRWKPSSPREATGTSRTPAIVAKAV